MFKIWQGLSNPTVFAIVEVAPPHKTIIISNGVEYPSNQMDNLHLSAKVVGLEPTQNKAIALAQMLTLMED